MTPGASFTAETVALQRSFESHRPASERLFCDPYADAFLRPALHVLATASAAPGLRRLAISLYDLFGGPGPRPSAIVRTRVIDDILTAALIGAEQCVVLGAGYDTRAHRLTALADRPVFEVDQPATQAVKRAVVGHLGLATGNVRYVAVDFERDDLAQRLLDEGFDPDTPTVFVWEGVTQYLSAEGVGATLAVVRRLSHEESLLVLTYVDVRALSSPSPFPEAARWVRAVARAGEPWIFGLLPEEAPEFLANRGFLLRSDVSTLDASRQFSRDRKRRDRGSALYRIATAEIA